MNAAYFRDWRRAHPEYRMRQNQLHNDRRRRLGRGDRRTEYARRPSRALDPIPALHFGHPLFDAARAVVGPNTSSLTVWLDPLHDDLISVATLALLRGRDAAEAVRRFRATETAWRRMTCQLFAGAGA